MPPLPEPIGLTGRVDASSTCSPWRERRTQQQAWQPTPASALHTKKNHTVCRCHTTQQHTQTQPLANLLLTEASAPHTYTAHTTTAGCNTPQTSANRLNPIYPQVATHQTWPASLMRSHSLVWHNCSIQTTPVGCMLQHVSNSLRCRCHWPATLYA